MSEPSLRITSRKVAVVADDDGPVRRLMEQVLTLEGWKVFTAADGIEALDLVARERPLLVLLDVMMPRLDGIQTCGALRSLPYGGDLVVVMVSAKTSSRDVALGLRCGFDDFVAKPFEPMELAERIMFAVARRGWRLVAEDPSEEIFPSQAV